MEGSHQLPRPVDAEDEKAEDDADNAPQQVVPPAPPHEAMPAHLRMQGLRELKSLISRIEHDEAERLTAEARRMMDFYRRIAELLAAGHDHDSAIRICVIEGVCPAMPSEQLPEKTAGRLAAWAIENSDAALLTKLLELNLGADSVVASRARNFSLLSLALVLSRFDLAKLLIVHGASAAGDTLGDFPPIELAIVSCTADSLAPLQFLLDHGADPNAVWRGRNGGAPRDCTPLIRACCSVSVPASAVSLLLARGADPNLATDTATPLLVAIGCDNFDAIRALVAAGADPNARGHLELELPVHAAILTQSVECVRLLVSLGAKVDHTAPEGCTPFAAAARRGDLEILQYLHDAGAEIDRMYALASLRWRESHLGALEWLLAHGCPAEPRDWAHESPIIDAAHGGSVAMVRALLAYGAYVNASDGHGRTALYEAAKRGRAPCCEYLLLAGASVNLRDQSGMSPLNLAARHGRTAAVSVLLEWGAMAHEDVKEQRAMMSVAPAQCKRLLADACKQKLS